MPTSGFSIKPLKVNLVAGQQKATECWEKGILLSPFLKVCLGKRSYFLTVSGEVVKGRKWGCLPRLERFGKKGLPFFEVMPCWV